MALVAAEVWRFYNTGSPGRVAGGWAHQGGREAVVRTSTLAVIVGAVALLGGFGVLRAWPIINVVETGKTPEYPDLVPRLYQADAGRVFDAVLHAVHRLPRWTLVAYQPETGEVRAEATTRLFRFVDDVLIRVVRRDGAVAVEGGQQLGAAKGETQRHLAARALRRHLGREIAAENDAVARRQALDQVPELEAKIGSLAISAPGTVYAAIASNARARDVLLPLLLFPILIPALLACVKATALIIEGDLMGQLGSWIRLLVSFNVIYWALGFVLFPRVIEDD